MKRAIAVIVIGAAMWFGPAILVPEQVDSVSFCGDLTRYNSLFSTPPQEAGAERDGSVTFSANVLTQRITCSWPAGSRLGNPPSNEAGSAVVKPGFIHYLGLVVAAVGGWLFYANRRRRLSGLAQ